METITLPSCQFLFWQRVKETVVEFYPTLHGAELPLALLSDAHYPSYRRTATGDDDLLSCLNLRKQARQVGLRFMDIHCYHRQLLENEYG